MLVPNVIIGFNGNHADIPSGFSRETSLDGKYPKGTAASVNPNTTGGADTHSHTSPTHSHVLNAHTHTFTSGDSDGGVGSSDGGSNLSNKSHTHTGTTGAIVGGDSDSTALTYGSVSNDPPYYEVIFIKSNSYNFIPVNGLLLNSATTRSGLTAHTASAGKYWKGASTGADAGTTGGSVTNTHDITHTHTTNTHTHGANTTNGPSNSDGQTSGGGGINAESTHTHTATTSTGTEPLDSYSTPLVTAETVEPAHRTLNSYINDGSTVLLPNAGDIGMYLGTLSTIPVGWLLCDGTNGTPDMRSKFLKIPSSPASTTTGGSNTHTHASQSHTHASTGGHTHTISIGSHTGAKNTVGSGVQDVAQTHAHSSVSSANDNSGYASGSTTADSSDNQPAFRTVAYIQFSFSIGGGALIGIL